MGQLAPPYNLYPVPCTLFSLMAHRWLLLFLLFLSACEQPLRLPYIPPTLHNWPQPYKGVPGLKLHAFHTGTVEVPVRLIYQGGSVFETETLDIVVFAIEHPRQGVILFGAGFNRAIAADADKYLGEVFSALGEASMKTGQDILAQLTGAKLSPEKVRYVIAPDLRFDHAGEIESFPAAKIIVSSAEHTAATDRDGDELYLAKEYDTVRQWQFIDFADAIPLGTFLAHHDLFGDGSVLLIDATGATAGGLAVLVRLPHAPVLLCGNLAWTREHYFYARPPGLLFDRQAWWEKAWRLKKLAELVPELAVFPDHDWEAVVAAKTADVRVHEFAGKEKESKEQVPVKRYEAKKDQPKKPAVEKKSQ